MGTLDDFKEMISMLDMRKKELIKEDDELNDLIKRKNGITVEVYNKRRGEIMRELLPIMAEQMVLRKMVAEKTRVEC